MEKHSVKRYFIEEPIHQSNKDSLHSKHLDSGNIGNCMLSFNTIFFLKRKGMFRYAYAFYRPVADVWQTIHLSATITH